MLLNHEYVTINHDMKTQFTLTHSYMLPPPITEVETFKRIVHVSPANFLAAWISHDWAGVSSQGPRCVREKSLSQLLWAHYSFIRHKSPLSDHAGGYEHELHMCYIQPFLPAYSPVEYQQLEKPQSFRVLHGSETHCVGCVLGWEGLGVPETIQLTVRGLSQGKPLVPESDEEKCIRGNISHMQNILRDTVSSAGRITPDTALCDSHLAGQETECKSISVVIFLRNAW